MWMPFAACVLLTIALGITAYRVGKSHNADAQVAPATSGVADTRIEALEQRISDAGHEREILRTQVAERDKVIAELRRQTDQQARSLDEMKSAQANLRTVAPDGRLPRSSESPMNELALRRNLTRLRCRCRRCNRNSIL